jgi:exodeoxyribonuclease VII small subunit
MTSDPKSAVDSKVDPKLSFEDALARVEQVVRSLEGGELGLGASIESYEQAVSHLKHCYGLLATAERRVELLTAIGPEGEALVTAFDDTATASSSESSPGRRKRATKKPGTSSDDSPGDLLSGLD